MNYPHKLAVLLNKLREADCGPIRKAGSELRCRCPAHDDQGPSLYVGMTEQAILLNCKAGCTAQAVCDRLDHTVADLFLDPDEPKVEVNDIDNIALELSSMPALVSTATNGVGAEVSPSVSGSDDVAQLRQAVYFTLRKHLELSTTHFDDLRRRGLSSEEISRRGYRTADIGAIRKTIDTLLIEYGRDRLLGVPGFQDRNGQVIFSASHGFLIPVRDLDGRIVALKIRHDANYNGSKYTWASSPGASCGNVVHVPLGITRPQATVRLTEGELKGDIATALSLGFCTFRPVLEAP